MISIDVTYRCNLSCTHCYFRTQGYETELTADQWHFWLENRRAQGYPFLICGWLGGEPFLRKDLLEKGLAYSKSNVIFTNGTFELDPWKVDIRRGKIAAENENTEVLPARSAFADPYTAKTNIEQRSTS